MMMIANEHLAYMLLEREDYVHMWNAENGEMVSAYFSIQDQKWCTLLLFQWSMLECGVDLPHLV